MTTQAHDVTREQIEHLCAGYRAGIEEPAFGTADQRLLRAAARSARYRSLQRRLGAPSALLLIALLAVLGSAAAGWFALSGSHPPTPPAAATVATRAVPRLQPGYVRIVVPALAAPALLASTSATVRIAELPPPPTLAVPASAVSGIAPVDIDLNAPGALAALRLTRPQDYRRIVVILAGITRHAQRDVPRWLQTNFDARDIVYQPLWLTSFPPKRRLRFSLERQRYRAVLTITDQGASVFPVDGTVQCRPSANRVVCGDPALRRQR